MKQKKCKECKQPFEQTRQLQPTCSSIDCQTSYAQKHLSKKSKEKKQVAQKEKKAFYEKHKPTLLQLAQKLVNQFIRLRDAGNLCISCGHNFANGRVENAGHFVRVSKSSFLRFNEDNIHLQCSYCNKELEGNEGAYKIKLTEKIGAERVRYLDENRSTLKRWTVEELTGIITTYRQKIKGLKDEQN